MEEQKKSYDSTHRIYPLQLVMVVVGSGQASSVVRLLNENEAYMCCICKGRGTSTSDFYDVLGIGDLKKDIIFSVIKTDRWPIIKKTLGERFKVSWASRGIAVIAPLDALAGVSIYKMLGNVRYDEEKKKTSPKRRETDGK